MFRQELRFLLPSEAQKKAHKENAVWGVSLVATSARGYAPLDLRPLPWGACMDVCEHGAKKELVLVTQPLFNIAIKSNFFSGL